MAHVEVYFRFSLYIDFPAGTPFVFALVLFAFVISVFGVVPSLRKDDLMSYDDTPPTRSTQTTAW